MIGEERNVMKKRVEQDILIKQGTSKKHIKVNQGNQDNKTQ